MYYSSMADNDVNINSWAKLSENTSDICRSTAAGNAVGPGEKKGDRPILDFSDGAIFNGIRSDEPGAGVGGAGGDIFDPFQTRAPGGRREIVHPLGPPGCCRRSVGADDDLQQVLIHEAAARRESETPFGSMGGDEHCHMLHTHGKAKADRLARNQLAAVSVLCLLFMAGEAIGGVLSNSLALFTDVLHLGSDLISFLISILAIYLSTKPATQKMSFGFHRAEVLGALFSVFIIWLVTGVLCYIAIERIIHEHYKTIHANEMLITATLGVVFNIVMGFVLHSEMCCTTKNSHKTFGHFHNHETSDHQPYRPLSQDPTELTALEMTATTRPASKHKNINVRAAFIHVLGDIIQSFGVLVAALIIKLQPDDRYKLADPICTFLFSILVIITSLSVLRDTLVVIMEGVPRDMSYQKVQNDLEALDNVKMVHSLCIWSLTIDKNALSVHLAIGKDLEAQTILDAATGMLSKRYGFYHTTIQIEIYKTAMSECPACLAPTR